MPTPVARALVGLAEPLGASAAEAALGPGRRGPADSRSCAAISAGETLAAVGPRVSLLSALGPDCVQT